MSDDADRLMSEDAALVKELEQLCREAVAAGLVVLELRCSCCGRHIDYLPTPWLLARVRPESIWTREPCTACQFYYATHGDWPVD